MRWLTVLLLLVVACGGGASPDDGATTTGPSSAPPQTTTTATPSTTMPSSMPTTTPPDPTLGEWSLVDGQVGDQRIELVSRAPITLAVAGDGVSGSSGCNTYFADGSVGELPLGPIGSTRMACAPDVMAAESLYLEGLARASQSIVEGDQFVLVGPALELRFDPAAFDGAALEETTWLLDVYCSADVCIRSEHPAELRLGGGTVDGTTGCNPFSGTYVLDGDRLSITQLAVTEIGCEPPIMAQEGAMLDVLNQSPEIDLAQNRLFLTAGDLWLRFLPAG